MKKNTWIIVACMALIAPVAQGASEWSAAEYDLYPGDFNAGQLGWTELLMD